MKGADLIDILEDDLGGEAVWKFAFIDGKKLRLGTFSIERSGVVPLPKKIEGSLPVGFRCLGNEEGGGVVSFDMVVHASGRFVIGNIKLSP